VILTVESFGREGTTYALSDSLVASFFNDLAGPTGDILAPRYMRENSTLRYENSWCLCGCVSLWINS
jgi:hypothetical protein